MIANSYDTKKPVAVRVHFNRCAMQRGWPEVWTVHTSKACLQVKQLLLNVTLRSRFDKFGKQPRAYFTGKARVRVANGIARLEAA